MADSINLKTPANNGWSGNWEEKQRLEGPSTSGRLVSVKTSVESNDKDKSDEFGIVTFAGECLEDPF